MLTVATVLFCGWLLAATLGTWAYFAGEPDSDYSSLQASRR